MCLLANAFGLSPLAWEESPKPRAGSFRSWVAGGAFPEHSIFHQHSRFSPALCEEIEAVPAHIVTIVRNPYDMFVSFYYWIQAKDERNPARSSDERDHPVFGKPIGHPDVLDFLSEGFRPELVKANGWLQSGRAVVVRYEALQADAVTELTRASETLAPVTAERLLEATRRCSPERMRQASPLMAAHVRGARVGDSWAVLTDVHLAVFRQRHADLVESLGYEVR